ncbi:DUF1015 domain-containing protein [Halocola ammonii]
MAKIIPFSAVRPARDKVHLVASRSYVSYTPEKLHDKLSSNPYTFIHIINPDFGTDEFTEPASYDRFVKVKDRYREFQQKGILEKDTKPALYIYRQIKEGHEYIGIICGVSIDDYLDGSIKVHEHTLTEREEMFKEYLDVTNFNAEPVLLTYPDSEEIEEITRHYLQKRPEYDFTTTNEVRHSLWLIEDPEHISSVEIGFANIPHLYIADGHHRSASSVLLGQKRRDEQNNKEVELLSDYFMACILPESRLQIYEFNRLVRDLGEHTPESFLETLEESFTIHSLRKAHEPERIHDFTLYLDGKWYLLQTKSDKIADSIIGRLDPQLLSDLVLDPILGIKDAKTDKRVSFSGGKTNLEEIKECVDRGDFAAAFILHPVTVSQLKDVADNGLIMPPKSTWIEPKLRSGLTIFELD